MLSCSVLVSFRYSGASICSMLVSFRALMLMSVGVGVCSKFSCWGALVLLLPIGADVCSVLECCGVLVLLIPIGVDDAIGGIMDMSCSVSGSARCFLGELEILLIILSTFLLVFDGLVFRLFAGVDMNMLESSDVKIVSGLPWDESDARLTFSTDLLLCRFVVSSWMRGEFCLSLCLCFAFSSFDCASDASFERCSNSLFDFDVRFVGVNPFFWLLRLSLWSRVFCRLGPICCSAWSRLVLLGGRTENALCRLLSVLGLFVRLLCC